MHSNGKALQTIYQNLFEGPTTERAYEFQQLALGSFSMEGRARFVAFLWKMNDGFDPQLTDEQIRAFGYLMGADQNSNTIKPWASGDLELW
jgi:hypothetical protein